MDLSVEEIRTLAERKLRQQTSRHNRSLRHILGHFEVLEHIKCRPLEGIQTAQLALARSPKVQDLSSKTRDSVVPTQTPSFDEKDFAVVNGVEVDEDDESSDDSWSSDDESSSDENDSDEFFDAVELDPVVRIKSDHSPPEYVEDIEHLHEKLHTQMSFQETTYEVTDDD